MPRLPADEDYARALLSIFGASGLRPLQSLGLDRVRTMFLDRNMGRAADFEAALDYAVSLGWLSSGFGRVRLTAPGDDEMQTIWIGRGVGTELPRHGQAAPSWQIGNWVSFALALTLLMGIATAAFIAVGSGGYSVADLTSN